jgi:acyl-CoA synthetase (AMP-forming)/AMP-acid ligase II
VAFWDELDRFGGAPALVGEDGAVTSYAALAAAADRWAAGLGPGRQLVFLLCENTAPTVTAYLGCLRARHVPLLLDARLRRALLDGLVAAYQPQAVVTPDGAIEPRPAPPVTLHADLALLLTTSGTTGSPKLVRLAARNLDANAAGIVATLGITAADRPITSLPLHYSYGLSVLHSHLAAGAATVLTGRSVLERAFFACADRTTATSLAGVPYTYQLLDRLGFFAAYSHPSLVTFTQAGGKLAPDLARAVAAHCAAHGRRFFTMYGQTEAAPRMACLPAERALDKLGSVGWPLPGGSVSLDDGELVYRGPNVMLGYATARADLARGDDCHGVLRTGDRATIDADGAVTITGRSARFLKITGQRLSLDEIEAALNSSGVTVAAVGGDDRLVLVTTDAAAADGLRRAVRRRFGIHPAHVEVHAVGALPLDSRGKVRYTELQEAFG